MQGGLRSEVCEPQEWQGPPLTKSNSICRELWPYARKFSQVIITMFKWNSLRD